MNNQECRIRPEIININGNEPIFYPYSIKVNKCSGSCNNINDPYAKLCVPDLVKNINIKVLNLMSRTNETRHVKWHETFAIINNIWIMINANVNAKNWLIMRCVIKGFIWNPSNCECEGDKSCDVGEYLD